MSGLIYCSDAILIYEQNSVLLKSISKEYGLKQTIKITPEKTGGYSIYVKSNLIKNKLKK